MVGVATNTNMQNLVTAEALMVSPREMFVLSSCDKAFDFDKKGIIYPNSEQMQFSALALSMLKTWILEGKDVKQELESLFDAKFSKEWFSCEAEYEAARRNTKTKFSRLYDYIIARGDKIQSVNAKFSREFDSPMCYKDKSIKGISGRFDFVLENANGQTGVLVCYGTPIESNRSRKEENRPENSIRLLSAAYASRIMRVELWYLSNKDDTGATMIDIFEHRPGKNVITFDYSLSEDEILAKLKTALGRERASSCDKCRHADVCRCERIDGQVRVESPQKDDKPAKARVFTCSQEDVIKHVNGPMCVVAVPGAGKTTALVERLVYLINTCHVRPSRILFVTFTKKARDEILERVKARLAGLGIKGMPVVVTYHSLGFSVLKENPMFSGKVRLATDDDRYRLIFRAMSTSPIIKEQSYIHPFGEYGIVRSLDSWFEYIQTDGESAFRNRYSERKDVDGIFSVYENYAKLYKEGGYINFDDQISLVNEVFEEHPSVSKRYADKYEYIMVDEFQDSSEDQVDMIYAIARHHNNIVVVGDDDQSIYKWRGGSSRFMLSFERDFPGAKMLYMEDNFRSNAGILKLCNALIKGTGNRFEKVMVTSNDVCQKPCYFKDVDSNYLATVVKSAISHGKPLGSIAVIARSNKRLLEAEQILDGVCPVSSPKDYLIKDAVFLMFFDILTLFYKGMDNDLALYRLSKVMGFDLPEKVNQRESFYQNMLHTGVITPIDMTSACFDSYEGASDFMACLAPIVACFKSITYGQLTEVVKFILMEILHLESHLVEKSLLEMADEKGIVNTCDLYDAMSNMVLFGSTQRVGYDVNPNAVNLLTAHDSKGKEFDTVIVFGMEDFSEEEEEVRVLYVALSRAKKNLFMIETAYNKYAGFDKIAPYIMVRGGAYD